MNRRLLPLLLALAIGGSGMDALAQITTGSSGTINPACIGNLNLPSWARPTRNPDCPETPGVPGPASPGAPAAAGDPARQTLRGLCPDRSGATIAAAAGPGCNAWPAELLASLAFGVHANAEGLAVTDTLRVFLEPGPAARAAEGTSFLAPFVIAAYRCYVTDSLGLPSDPGPGGDRRTARRTLTLGELFESDCLPVPGTWHYQVNRHPPLQKVVTAATRLFWEIGHEIHLLELDRTRLAGIFGNRPAGEPVPPREQVESAALRPINRPLQLSRLALRLAEASRVFLKTTETMLRPGRDGALPNRSRTWIAALDTLFPATAELSALSLDDRVDLVAAILATPSPVADR